MSFAAAVCASGGAAQSRVRLDLPQRRYIEDVQPREGFWPALAVAVLVFVGIMYLLLLLGLRVLPEWTDTAPGRGVAAYWLGIRDWLRGHDSFGTLPPAAVAVWGRYIAYGVALGAAPGAVSGIDLDVGANELLWSDATGSRRDHGRAMVPVGDRRHVLPHGASWGGGSGIGTTWRLRFGDDSANVRDTFSGPRLVP